VHPFLELLLMKPLRLTLLLVLLGLFWSGQLLLAQPNPYAAYFEEAYQKHPSVPRGLLEAVAYTNTRLQHLTPTPSCQEIPVYHGVMGLIEDGKGYFQNNLIKVSTLSGYSVADIKRDPRINILAYASAYAKLQQNKRMANQRVETHRPIIDDLTELPNGVDAVSQYARDQQFYGVLQEIQAPHTERGLKSRRLFNFESIFGQANYRVLSADRVTVEQQKVRNRSGDTFDANNRSTCTSSHLAPDYAGALFSAANSRNYGSRDGAEVKYITMHTVQGSYASAIAWFKNRNARVSAHYVIRASDGQITQMVCESDKAYHVRTDNAESIGIEHEGFIDDGTSWYTNEMYESSAALVRDICKRYGIDPLKTYGGPPTDGIRTLSNKCYHVKGHQHFRGNNHIDPGPLWDWDRFYRLVNETPEPKTFTARSATFYDSGGKDGNYENGVRQTYLIAPEDAVELRLTFESFNLEGSGFEPFDYLDIYDGKSVAGRFIGRFTGSQPPDPILARSGALYLEFRSDCQVNRSGWKASYQATTDKSSCPAPEGLIASDLFPMGATLSWEAIPDAQRYLLLIKRRNLEDKFTLYRTTSNRLTVTGLAANALYSWQVAALCSNGDTSALVGALFTTPNTNRTGQAQAYTVRSNQGRFYDSGGTLGGYGDNENYLYRIIPPDGGRVELTFESFETEEELDKLTVYDGINVSSADVLGTFSGKARPGKLVSSGNGLTVHFYADNRTNADGWLASWRSVGGSGPPPTEPDPDPGSSTPEPVTPPVAGVFEPSLEYPRTAPTTTPILEEQYQGDFTVRFNDEDNSGRGLANRFYQIVAETPAGWRANPGAGFFFDDFSQGLRSFWNSSAGNWKVEKGLLTQSNLTLGNTNLHTDLTQNGKEVYLYHWQARMSGESNNRRHGIHFFCSEPDQDNRGNSYFIWIRDQDDGAFLEIYKTVNNAFDRKVRKAIDFERGAVYDYKTIYNPQKGRIEVYINDEFGASWVDPYPLTQGKGLSLRSGNCLLTLDNVKVYQAREGSVQVNVGEASGQPLQGEGRFLVQSLVVDRNIDWSPVGRATARLGSSPAPSPTPTPDPGPTPTPTPDPVTLADSYRGDFQLSLSGQGETYFLPSDYVGQWTANRNLGFLHEDFFGTRLDAAWRKGDGRWSSRSGTLLQSDGTSSNTNLYLPLTQGDEAVYLYQLRAKMLSEGENKRLGLHFFASSGRNSNRGDSYLVWLRFNGDKPGRIEVYRSENNELPSFRASEVLDLKRDVWYDLKVRYDPSQGQIEVILDGASILTWRDDKAPLRSGQYISFRTGGAEAEFDDFRVYQLAKQNPLPISVGPGEMLRYKNKARLYLISRMGDRWSPVEIKETRVK
jgi:N-acetyl-anhydromuramyl-L-alanine amidase AmpD